MKDYLGFVAAVAVSALMAILLGVPFAPQAAPAQPTPLPFTGQIEIDGVRYRIMGEAIPYGASAPTPEPSGFTPYTVSPLGAHAWSYNADTLLAHPHDCMAGVLVPGELLYQGGYTWEQFADVCQWVGPAESVLERLSSKVANHVGAGSPVNVAIYVPEWPDYGDYGQPGSGVDPEEVEQLEAYLTDAVAMAQDHGVALAYGPSTALVSSEWVWGQSYTLDGDVIAGLAALLRPGDLWIIRPMQMQFVFGPGPDFAGAIEEYLDYIHAGNPDVSVWVHLALQHHEGAGDEFLAYRESLMGLDIAGTYMGVAGGNEPDRHAGTVCEMQAVFDATGGK